MTLALGGDQGGAVSWKPSEMAQVGGAGAGEGQAQVCRCCGNVPPRRWAS